MFHLTEVMNISGSPESLLILQFIEDSLDRLRSLSQYSVLENWRFLTPSSLHDSPDFPSQNLPIACLNERNHIAWPRGKQCCWVYQRLQWPSDLKGYSLQGYKAKLALRWWADLAELYVNGVCIQTGDLFDCFTRLPLSESVEPGHSVEVALRLVSPGHDDGALVRSQLIFESPDDNFPEPGFIADELAVLYRYLKQFAPEELREFAHHLEGIAWEQVCDRSQFQTSLQALRQRLLPWSAWIKQRQINRVGHAHLDLAWLWPISDTWDAAERTFQSVLSLQQDFPELTYTHSSPALFAWLEANRPELFQRVQEQVKKGSWAIDAGLWVEPELNIISGESIVRQILYGQRYCEEKFGQSSKIAWLPDTFGFNWQLPQLLAQGGIRCFATQKLRWNDTNPFPHDWCWWEGLDGTRILSLTLPLIGSDIDPVEMADYATQWEANTHIPQSLWLPGVGDHGGGPTRDMLEKARRWANSPFFPTLTFTHVTDFIDTLLAGRDSTSPTRQTGRQSDSTVAVIRPENSSHHSYQDVNRTTDAISDLPVWKDELYLELHRGCYTTHADQKWYNRRCEDLLYQAELFASIATLVADQPYPQEALETAWKQVLFNQFHDILPGSSIPEVFEEANQTWQQALQATGKILEDALEAISNQIAFPKPPVPNAHPVVVFNSLNWDRTELVAVQIPQPLRANQSWQIFDATGKALTTQVVHDQISYPPQSYPPVFSDSPHILFQADTIPSVGYSVFWLAPCPESSESGPQTAADSAWILENADLRATIHPETGDLSSLYDKAQQREVLSGPGNQLNVYTDLGQYWDAWNIAPDYKDHPKAPTELLSIQWIEQGPLRQKLRVTRQLGQSLIQQDYVLETSSNYLKINTVVDWQETQTLLKAAFPLTLSAEKATYEIPFGAIDRSTNPQTSQEKAKWEVPALRWASLSDADWGFSLLTDSKHGFDASPNQLCITLLKAPLWPDPQADRGRHATTLALYPHAHTWREAQTTHQACAFNIPLQVFLPSSSLNDSQFGTQPHHHSFLSFDSSSNLVLTALKRSESDPNQFILRLYEAYGKTETLTMINHLNLAIDQCVDILEKEVSLETVSDSAESLDRGITFLPWRVRSFSLKSEDVRSHSNHNL